LQITILTNTIFVPKCTACTYIFWKRNFPRNPHVCQLVGQLVWSVCQNFLQGRLVTLRRSYRRTFFLMAIDFSGIPYFIAIKVWCNFDIFMHYDYYFNTYYYNFQMYFSLQLSLQNEIMMEIYEHLKKF